MGYLRITGGLNRGRKIVAPAGKSVRPMQDFLREALFSILGSRIAGAVTMDCFAGTGSLGLEGLSRGARKCFFLEKHPPTLTTLQANIQRCGVESQAIIIKADWFRADIAQRVDEKIDLAFFDPPFAIDHQRVAQRLCDQAGLFRDAVLVYRYPAGAQPFSPEMLFEPFDHRRYGGSELVFGTLRKSTGDGTFQPEDNDP